MPEVPLVFYSMFGDMVQEPAHLVGVSELISKSQPAAVLIKKARTLLYGEAA